MKKRNEELYNDPWDRDFYETGSTRPPKNYGGVIAVLLILVILLCGAVTFLGVMNIRLFQMLEVQQQTGGEDIILDASTPLDPEDLPTDGTAETGKQENRVRIGVECVTVSSFDRRYYRLPEGCLVMGVTENGSAQRAGIRTGDVIVSLNGKSTHTVETLSAMLKQHQPGETVDLTVYRSKDKKHITISVLLSEES